MYRAKERAEKDAARIKRRLSEADLRTVETRGAEEKRRILGELGVYLGMAVDLGYIRKIKKLPGHLTKADLHKVELQVAEFEMSLIEVKEGDEGMLKLRRELGSGGDLAKESGPIERTKMTNKEFRDYKNRGPANNEHLTNASRPAAATGDGSMEWLMDDSLGQRDRLLDIHALRDAAMIDSANMKQASHAKRRRTDLPDDYVVAIARLSKGHEGMEWGGSRWRAARNDSLLKSHLNPGSDRKRRSSERGRADRWGWVPPAGPGVREGNKGGGPGPENDAAPTAVRKDEDAHPPGLCCELAPNDYAQKRRIAEALFGLSSDATAPAAGNRAVPPGVVSPTDGSSRAAMLGSANPLPRSTPNYPGDPRRFDNDGSVPCDPASGRGAVEHVRLLGRMSPPDAGDGTRSRGMHHDGVGLSTYLSGLPPRRATSTSWRRCASVSGGGKRRRNGGVGPRPPDSDSWRETTTSAMPDRRGTEGSAVAPLASPKRPASGGVDRGGDRDDAGRSLPGKRKYSQELDGAPISLSVEQILDLEMIKKSIKDYTKEAIRRYKHPPGGCVTKCAKSNRDEWASKNFGQESCREGGEGHTAEGSKASPPTPQKSVEAPIPECATSSAGMPLTSIHSITLQRT